MKYYVKTKSLNVHERPFPNHRNDKGKAHVMIASVVENEEMTLKPEVEPNLDQNGQMSSKFVQV